jgi:GntR family transcriptional regulator/MocR family aminotransferase
MRTDGFEKHLRRMRNVHEQRRNLMVQHLKNAQESGMDISFNIPDGGMALWLDAKKNSDKIAEYAESKGLVLFAKKVYFI